MQTYFVFPFVPLGGVAYSAFFYQVRKHPINLVIQRVSNFSVLYPDSLEVDINFLFFDYYVYVSRTIFNRPFNKNRICCFGVYNSFFFSPRILNQFNLYIKYNNSLSSIYNIVNLRFFAFLVGKFYFNVLEFLFFSKLRAEFNLFLNL